MAEFAFDGGADTLSTSQIGWPTRTAVDASTRSTIEGLQRKLERHNLMIQTLLMILLEKKVIHEPEFREWLRYVDELDGIRDGKLRSNAAPQVCPSCRRRSPKSAPNCIYCSHELEEDFLYQRPQA